MLFIINKCIDRRTKDRCPGSASSLHVVECFSRLLLLLVIALPFARMRSASIAFVNCTVLLYCTPCKTRDKARATMPTCRLIEINLRDSFSAPAGVLLFLPY